MKTTMRAVALVAMLALSLGVAACGGSSPMASLSPTPSPTPLPSQSPTGAAGFEEWRTAYCAAWLHLFTAVGNPDTGSGSDLTRSMDAGIVGGDQPAVDRAAGDIKAELENGRQDVAFGGGWTPAKEFMGQFDRLFVSYEAMTETKRANVGLGLAEAQRLGQEAFVNAGAGDAWQKLRDGSLTGPMKSAIPATVGSWQCPGVPVGG